MRSMVVYESYFGCTQHVAEAIGEGLTAFGTVQVVPVADARGLTRLDVDLLVVGGPTHVHGMSSQRSRESAVGHGATAVSSASLGFGLREWFEALEKSRGLAAAFDTRVDGPALMTGRASKGIANRLRRHGLDLVTEPESFLVQHEILLPAEAARARAWAEGIGRTIAQTPASVG